MLPTVDLDDDRTVGGDGERFLIFVVPADFEPQLCPVTWGLLQTPHTSKLLDLTPARSIRADLFEALARAWTAPPGSVPRLGLVLPFERWAVLHDLAVAALAPLAAQGVEIAILYEQQARGNHLRAWFAHGRILHDVPAAVASLLRQCTPGATWPLVLDAVIALVRAHAFTADVPALLVDTAELALTWGGAVEAESLAREALYYLSDVPSSARANALRLLGVALVVRDQRRAGLVELDRAILMAGVAADPIVGAIALYQAGAFALEYGDHADAERRLRQVIALLEPLTTCRNLLASAHHNLAVALHHQGKGDADRHVASALDLRPDVDGSLAEQDRQLLATLMELRANVN